MTNSFAETLKQQGSFDEALMTAQQTAQRVIATGVGRTTKLEEVLPSLASIGELEGEIQRITGEGVNFDVLLAGTREEREREIFTAIQGAFESGRLDAAAIRGGGRAAEEEIAFIQKNLGDKIGLDKNSMRRLLQQLAAREGGGLAALLPDTPTMDPNKISGGLVDSAGKLTREEITQAPTRIAVEGQMTSPTGQDRFGNMLGDLQGQTMGVMGGPALSGDFLAIANAAGKITNETLKLSALAQQFGKGDVRGLVGYYLLGPEEAGSNVLDQLKDIDTTVGNIGDKFLQEGPLAKRLTELKSNPIFKEAQETTDQFRETVQTGLAALPKAYNNVQTTLAQFNTLVETLKPALEALAGGAAGGVGSVLVEGGKLTDAGRDLAVAFGKAVFENLKVSIDLGSGSVVVTGK